MLLFTGYFGFSVFCIFGYVSKNSEIAYIKQVHFPIVEDSSEQNQS